MILFIVLNGMIGLNDIHNFLKHQFTSTYLLQLLSKLDTDLYKRVIFIILIIVKMNL